MHVLGVKRKKIELNKTLGERKDKKIKQKTFETHVCMSQVLKEKFKKNKQTNKTKKQKRTQKKRTYTVG